MADDIYINDFANPELTPTQQSIMEYGKTLDIDLSRDSIMQEAERLSGLSDWGPSDFLDRLNLICDEWGSDTALLGTGKLSLRNKLVQHATSRLLIHDQWQRHPEILDVEIEAPIIVAGLPRSGTTHLLNLMASDSRLRCLPLWESYEPVPRQGEGILPNGVDPRYVRCAQAWEGMQMSTPFISHMHPMDPEHIHEELELMGPNFGSYNYEWLCYSPCWRDHYYGEDQTYQYEYMRDVLKLLTWQQRNTDRPTRWVLKCPQHLEQLPILRKVFPDATVAITQRDPIAVIQSALTINLYGQRMSRSTVLMDQTVDYWVERIDHLLQACVRDRGCIPESQSIDVPFKSLIADDITWVEKVYEKANLEMTDQARGELSGFMKEKQGAYGRVVYNIQEQFGLDPEVLRERFAYYTKDFM